MSYDWPDDVPHPEEKPMTRWERTKLLYWRFVIWAALDAKSAWLNRWGMRRLNPRNAP